LSHSQVYFQAYSDDPAPATASVYAVNPGTLPLTVYSVMQVNPPVGWLEVGPVVSIPAEGYPVYPLSAPFTNISDLNFAELSFAEYCEVHVTRTLSYSVAAALTMGRYQQSLMVVHDADNRASPLMLSVTLDIIGGYQVAPSDSAIDGYNYSLVEGEAVYPAVKLRSKPPGDVYLHFTPDPDDAGCAGVVLSPSSPAPVPAPFIPPPPFPSPSSASLLFTSESWHAVQNITLKVQGERQGAERLG